MSRALSSSKLDCSRSRLDYVVLVSDLACVRARSAASRAPLRAKDAGGRAPWRAARWHYCAPLAHLSEGCRLQPYQEKSSSLLALLHRLAHSDKSDFYLIATNDQTIPYTCSHQDRLVTRYVSRIIDPRSKEALTRGRRKHQDFICRVLHSCANPCALLYTLLPTSK